MTTKYEQRTDYSTSERKLIYSLKVIDKNNDWLLFHHSRKIGDASIKTFEIDARANSDDLKNAANKRIKQYMGPIRVPYKIEWAELAYRDTDHKWFRDYDVHDVLKRSGVKKNSKLSGDGGEWYVTDDETVKNAISAVKNGNRALNSNDNNSRKQENIILRPEQKKAVNKTKKAFKHNNKVLWNAKMRFGKTLTALQLIKEMKYRKVLIMTHRPVVNTNWYDDFNKIDMPGYQYASKNKGEDSANLNPDKESFIYFASIQDLAGSDKYNKNEMIFNTNWDLIIVDEAHEGTQTEISQNIINRIKIKNTKFLELSGTPFNILSQYNPEQVFTWDYVDEQKSKKDWNLNSNKPNPYIDLPSVSMYTFEMKNHFNSPEFEGNYNKSFNFKEFFKTNDKGKFVHENKVWQFLNNITTYNKNTKYPFSQKKFRENLRHTLWILPGIHEATALANLMKKHPVFGKEYNIINVVEKNDNAVEDENDLNKVKKAIGNKPSQTKTITLTVRKLTTGVTVKPWTGVVFLSNTNSAIQYLQAAFRAQTPYSDSSGTKTNCYIFDFAPDRALTVMAETTHYSTGSGKLNTNGQKDRLGELVNFLPIIGEKGQGMQRFYVEKLLTKLKRAYAEKAVNTGFDDDSIYNDKLLLKLKPTDLDEFNDLKRIVGKTKSEKKKVIFDVNKQGLDKEEYQKSLQGEKKPKKKRTKAEQDAVDKKNKLKKQRKTMISILRSISIRIPLMIYGLSSEKIDFNKDVNISTFINNIDERSWEEFMPAGVTKKKFKQFAKFYDPEVFIEAGRIIRQKVKDLDNEDPLERIEQLALIFSHFRNPDKETVLTPWRIVNMQLGKTIGGLSFYDEDYQNTINNMGKSIRRFDNTYLTPSVFKDDTKILEINSKTGLYPLYVAAKLYSNKFNDMNNKKGGKFYYDDQLNLWKDILKNNIFVVAKTPMAKEIAQRTLCGYKNLDTNIIFVKNLVERSKNNINECAKTIIDKFNERRKFNIMKFDAVIGNPPYQSEAKGEGTRGEPIYNSFMDLSFKLSDVVTLITPGRFLFNAGQTPKPWNRKILNDKHIKIIDYEQNSDKIFPHTDIKGGVVITLRDTNKDFGKIGIFTPYKQLNSIVNKVWQNDGIGLNTIISSRGSFRFSSLFFEKHPEAKNRLGKGTNDMIVSNSFEKLPEVFFDEKPDDDKEYVALLGRLNNVRLYKYIRRDYVKENPYIDNYKVIVPEANGSGAIGEVLSTPLIGTPLIGTTDTFINIGPLKYELNAHNAFKYIKTRFARTMLGVKKATQHNPKTTWQLVPIQDFTNHSDIDWSKSIDDIDKQLFDKYKLDENEIKFIDKNVQGMD